MDFANEPVFTKADPDAINAVLYQAMFDETIRLRKCPSRRERENIRKFLTAAYQQLSPILRQQASVTTNQQAGR